MKIAKLLFLICFFGVQQGFTQSEVLRAVKDENRAAILYQVRLGADLNEQFKPEKYTPLSYAIKRNCSKAFIKWLLDQGLDPDKPNNGKTPLMYAIKYDRVDLIPLIIESGAEVNKKNSAKETALIYAVKNNKVKATDLLLSFKADAKIIDHKKRSAISYAEQNGNKDILELLGLEKIYKIKREGPHVYFNSKDSISIHTINPLKDSFKIVEKQQFLKDGKTQIKCTSDQDLVSHTFTIDIDINNIPKAHIPDTLPDVVYVFSDINGNFHGLRSFLVNNKIIDINLNWIAKDAHLVLLGDVFAKGKNVTPTLWLIYKLSQQAIKSNGAVHFILGNRELEVLTGNAQNLHLKYKDIEAVTNKKYVDQFDKNSLLGLWLRQQPMLIKMDSFLFSHAGLNPMLVEKEWSVPFINSVVGKYINNEVMTAEEQKIAKDLISAEGPSKFKKMASAELDQIEVERICDFYRVNLIIQGQKQVNRSKYLYNQKVLLTNTPKPKDSKTGKPAGLFIKKGYPYILKDKRKVIEI